MALFDAITDIRRTLESLEWCSVFTEEVEQGSEEYLLIMKLADCQTVYHFGARKISQGINLLLKANGPQDLGELSARLDEINEKLVEDRRRNAQAQTTITSNVWTVLEDRGREGIDLTTTIEVLVYES